MVLRIYGYEGEPYLLPKFIRVFALELIRQRLASDWTHFTSKSHKSTIASPGSFLISLSKPEWRPTLSPMR